MCVWDFGVRGYAANAGRLSRRTDAAKTGNVIGRLSCADTNQMRGDCQVHAYYAKECETRSASGIYFYLKLLRLVPYAILSQ